MEDIALEVEAVSQNQESEQKEIIESKEVVKLQQAAEPEIIGNSETKEGAATQEISQIPQSPIAQRVVKVATINYCGILNNPFQFYNSTYLKQLEQISSIFRSVVISHFSEKPFVDWQMGKVQQKVRYGRYSPAFELGVGIRAGKFQTQEQFYSTWNERFQNYLKQSKLQFKQEHINNTREYDFLYYKALLQYVFGDLPFQELISNDTNYFKDQLAHFYSQSFLDQNRKLLIFQKSLEKINADIFFLQEYSPLVEEYLRKLEKYYIRVDDSKDTMIVLKNGIFSEIKETHLILSEDEIKSLNWGQKTSILIADNIILINLHLNSSKGKNDIQISQLNKVLPAIKANHQDYHIILGADINSFLPPSEDLKEFNMYPNQEEQLTTLKKRTFAQGQFKKSDVSVGESKDKILTDLQIKEGSKIITYIDYETIPDKNSYVPTSDHPFDHFLVSCEIILDK